MTSLAATPQSAATGSPAPSAPPPTGLRRVPADVILGLCLSIALLVVAFVSSGGVDQTAATAGATWTEIVLTLLGAAAVAAAALGGGRQGGPAWGAATVALMAALTALTALSITWSVVPDTSWSAANQMLSYLAALAAAAALARLVPGRWPALLGAIALLAAALSGWALLAKVFPATLAPNNVVGRLQSPFGYWNALGGAAAVGLPAALWAGARRGRGRWLAGLSAPAIALMLSAVVLTFSRSADAVAVVEIAVWLAFVPLRLRSAAILALGAAGAAPICAWALSHSALTANGGLTAGIDSAGHTFGVVGAIALVLVTAAGVASARAMDRRSLAPPTRRRVAVALIVLATLFPVAAIGALATSSRGLTGQISHAWSTLTSTTASVANNPGRVFQLGSSRPMYWREGIDVGTHALLGGVGASGFGTARLRYTEQNYEVNKAHSYPVQTFADLGLIGLAITLALLVAWGLAAARPLAPRTGWRALTPAAQIEREGMAALALTVIGFGIQSTLDWTWYFPGVSVPVLLCAGWLAGRGPLGAPVGWRRSRRSLIERPAVVATAVAVAVLALAGAWLQWQPLRSVNQTNAAIDTNSSAQRFADARAAITSDPLAYEPRFVLARLYQSLNDIPAARAQLIRATQIQPENPFVWAQLGSLEFQTRHPRDAIAALHHVVALDHTPDPTVTSTDATIAQAQAQIAHRAAAPAGG